MKMVQRKKFLISSFIARSIFLALAFFLPFYNYFYSQDFIQKSDVLPGFSGYLSNQDTGFVVNVVDDGFFGDKDFFLEVFLTKSNTSLKSYYFGTEGRESFAFARYFDNKIFLTGSTNLFDGFNDDILLSCIDLSFSSNSWSKLIRGNLTEKGKEIFIDNSNVVLLANSNSLLGYLALNILWFDLEGNFVKQIQYDIDESFYPTSFTSGQGCYYVSGYNVQGSKLIGKVLKFNSTDDVLEWCVSFNNDYSAEINEILEVEGKLYFFGWSGNGTNKPLLYGEISSIGEVNWFKTILDEGLHSVSSVLLKEGALLANGAIRVPNGNEEEHAFYKIDTTSKEVKIFYKQDIEKSYGSSRIISFNDSLFVSSFGIKNNTEYFGMFNFLENNNNNGCFEDYTFSEYEDQSSFLSFSSEYFYPTTYSLDVINKGSVYLSNDNYYSSSSCSREVNINSIQKFDNNCLDNFTFNELINKSKCSEYKIYSIRTYSQLGELISESFYTDSLTYLGAGLYFLKVTMVNNQGDVLVKTLKFLKS